MSNNNNNQDYIVPIAEAVLLSEETRGTVVELTLPDYLKLQQWAILKHGITSMRGASRLALEEFIRNLSD